jgi:hypothetical protein
MAGGSLFSVVLQMNQTKTSFLKEQKKKKKREKKKDVHMGI